MEFQCIVTGSDIVVPATQPSAICAIFKDSVDTALARKTVGVKALSKVGDIDWIKVDVSILKRGGITALVSRKQGPTEQRYPEIRVDVMDRALSETELNILAAEVGKILKNTGENRS